MRETPVRAGRTSGRSRLWVSLMIPIFIWCPLNRLAGVL